MKTRPLGPSGLTVSAVGLGGMYLSIQDRPSEDDAVRTVHAALDAGVTLIDTADVYCLDDRDLGHNERVIARALREKPGAHAVVATKGGLERPRGAWTRNARPAHLRQACERSLKALGVERIDVYQLHAPDPAVPFAESVGELAKLRAEGKIAHVGLSNVSVREIDEARRLVPVVSVQNRWNPEDRSAETDGVLDQCTELGLAFLPYSPFGGAGGAKALTRVGALVAEAAKRGISAPKAVLGLSRVGKLAAEAARRGMSPHRLVLAWMLARSPVVLPIPGARRVESVVDSAQASEVVLSADDVRVIEASFP